MTRSSWDEYALAVAQAAAGRSEDPYLQVGAAVLRPDHTVASLGYNGPPPNIELDWQDRDARRPFIVHAEANALRYVHPGEGWLIATTTMPCAICLLSIASYAIKRVVFGGALPPHYDTDLVAHIADVCDIEMVDLS